VEHPVSVAKADRGLSVTVLGGGILGLWQAFELTGRGHAVTLREAMQEEDTGAASRFAGAMLAPYCEAEAAEPIVLELGLRGLARWRRSYPGLVARGTLVVASARDRAELTRFERLTKGHRRVGAKEIADLEPDLAGRFSDGLFYPDEAHLSPRAAIGFLIGELRRLGVDLRFGDPAPQPVWMAAAAGEVAIDCRGIAAKDDLPNLRGVRGEMAVVEADVELTRPVRLLHPRFPLYVVPWGERRFMLGATMIETDDARAVTVRSAFDILSCAVALHPGFADAAVLELSSGTRPAFPDNIPGIAIRGRHVMVNGAYRHGFLLAPALAEILADYLETGVAAPGIIRT